ncbi:hypothetical protein J3458_003301 [Metarhizium acridum]|nr:hypothetical protein J3458_003301 [Metarhizium acridum]
MWKPSGTSRLEVPITTAICCTSLSRLAMRTNTACFGHTLRTLDVAASKSTNGNRPDADDCLRDPEVIRRVRGSATKPSHTGVALDSDPNRSIDQILDGAVPAVAEQSYPRPSLRPS